MTFEDVTPNPKSRPRMNRKFLSSLLNPFLLFGQIEIHVLLLHAGAYSTPSLSCALLPSSHASAFFPPSIWATCPEIQYR